MTGHGAGHGKTLELDSNRDAALAAAVFKALASETRLQLLRVLGPHTLSVNQLAELLELPASTVALHVKILESAQLLSTSLQPAQRGLQKMCSRRHDQLLVQLPPLESAALDAAEVAMPIGAYVDFSVYPTCGLASATRIIGMIDDPASFLEPERLEAQILWFRHGFVEYLFPYRVPIGAQPQSLQLRLESCSEAPTHHERWPSDLTVWINGVELGTWTCPSDFGGTRGALTPDWWLDTDSQFGLLKRWEVNGTGTFIDGVQISSVRLGEVVRGPGPVSVRVGVKEDARHVGGLNLFGRGFGNYPEDLVLRFTYQRDPIQRDPVQRERRQTPDDPTSETRVQTEGAG